MKKRKITGDEYHILCDTFNQLAEILLVVGVVELKISKKDKEIFWDTENGAQVDPEALERFSAMVEEHYWQIIEKAQA